MLHCHRFVISAPELAITVFEVHRIFHSHNSWGFTNSSYLLSVFKQLPLRSVFEPLERLKTPNRTPCPDLPRDQKHHSYLFNIGTAPSTYNTHLNRTHLAYKYSEGNKITVAWLKNIGSRRPLLDASASLGRPPPPVCGARTQTPMMGVLSPPAVVVSTSSTSHGRSTTRH